MDEKNDLLSSLSSELSLNSDSSPESSLSKYYTTTSATTSISPPTWYGSSIDPYVSESNNTDLLTAIDKAKKDLLEDVVDELEDCTNNLEIIKVIERLKKKIERLKNNIPHDESK